MKKNLLGVAVTVMAGVIGIFAFSGCIEIERCKTDPSQRDSCIEMCEQVASSPDALKAINKPDEAISWCEANGVDMSQVK